LLDQDEEVDVIDSGSRTNPTKCSRRQDTILLGHLVDIGISMPRPSTYAPSCQSEHEKMLQHHGSIRHNRPAGSGQRVPCTRRIWQGTHQAPDRIDLPISSLEVESVLSGLMHCCGSRGFS
jgi:hypothetical protein